MNCKKSLFEMQRPSAAGFTLVELAIVLMIIGLLIGGILRGQELMENARVTTTIQQVHAYSAATTTFRDQYNAMPGDMQNALNRIPNCSTDTNCANGNGDGIIGSVVGNYLDEPWTNVDPSIASENTQFWKHLSMTHMIAGVNPSASTPEWGKSHPTSKMNGGFFARYTTMVGSGAGGGSWSANSWSGVIIVMRNPISGDWQCGGGSDPASFCSISPLRAAQVDRKMDDGMAEAGDVRAVSANWASGCGTPGWGTQNNTGYDETHTDNACDIMFRIF